MQLLVCVLSSVHLAASVFFHENSPIDLAPTPDAKNSDFGFSLAYQKGKNANLLVGAPLYDLTGRVYQCPLDDIREEKNTCKPLHIDFDEMGIRYNRSLSKQQHFYLGASIAATEKFFVTCAPLRTDYHFMRHYDTETMFYGAYGVCFYYDQSGAHACNGHGLERDAKRNISLQNDIYGGAGWTTLVDEPHDRILIAKSFASGDIIAGRSSKPESNYGSLVRRNLIQMEKGITNYGQALTVGNYFDTDEKATFYAVSFKRVTAQGGIDFFNGSTLQLAYTLSDAAVGSMFGEALCSADVTGDGRADLFVGAPALVTDARSYDRGAVHVYTKSDQPLEMVMKMTIISDKDGGRFGTTLATNDVDGDLYPEIFVSAISENYGAGALYVLCGFEIYESIHNSPYNYLDVTVSDLKRTQRIEKKSFTGFGFSVQPVPDFNDNGSDELSVSAPDNSTVSLYRGVRAVTAKVTSRFAEATDKSESTNEYTFHSCVAIDLPPKPRKITTKLLVKNVLNGRGASIKNVKDATYQIDLATEKGVKNINNNNTEYCKNLSMIIPSVCKVTTEVSLMENIQEHEKFDNTWVSLSAQSKLKNEVQLTCRCNDTTCAPNLTVQLGWSGRNRTNYVVGSTRSEKVTLSVHNNGTTGCDSCVRVRVSGALVEKLQCQFEEPEYLCTLASPFRPNTTQKIEVLLLMDKITNQDKEFIIEVFVEKTCGSEATPYSTELRVPYEFNADLLIINGSVVNRNISDTELLDETEEIITDEQTYTIVNNRSITWKNVLAKITADKKPFIQRFTVSSIQADKCDEYNGTDKFSSACLVTLAPNSTVKLVLTTTIRKKEIANYFSDWKITIDSELVLKLSLNMSKSKTLTTMMMFEKEQTVSHNRSLVLTIAVVVALFLLLIITFILYKLNFFKRKNKEELKVLKREIQKRSVRRTSSSGAQAAQDRVISQVTNNMDDIVIIDEPFEPTPVSDLDPGTSEPAAADKTAQAN